MIFTDDRIDRFIIKIKCLFKGCNVNVAKYYRTGVFYCFNCERKMDKSLTKNKPNIKDYEKWRIK